MDERNLLAWIPRLRRYARVLHKDPGGAEDLVQETLERALVHRAKWPGLRDMRAWLFTLMHNLSVDGHRRKPMFTTDVEESDQEWGEVSFCPDPLLVRDVERAYGALPVEQQEVLMLVVAEDMAYADVAAVLGVPLGTVMSRLSRARERMRRYLEEGIPQMPLRRVK